KPDSDIDRLWHHFHRRLRQHANREYPVVALPSWLPCAYSADGKTKGALRLASEQQAGARHSEGQRILRLQRRKSRRRLCRWRIGPSTVSAALYAAACRTSTGRRNESSLRPELVQPMGSGRSIAFKE